MNEIINNLKRDNHLQKLLRSFENAIDILIVSPFISNSIDFFPFAKLKRIKRLTIITTLKPKDLDQYFKVPFFKQLFEFCNNSNIELNLLIENSLHGKVYISKYENGASEGIITSANFTNNGLRLNNEWGTKISDQEKIAELENGILSKVILEPLKEKDIDHFLELIAKRLGNLKITQSQKNSINKIMTDLSTDNDSPSLDNENNEIFQEDNTALVNAIDFTADVFFEDVNTITVIEMKSKVLPIY